MGTGYFSGRGLRRSPPRPFGKVACPHFLLPFLLAALLLLAPEAFAAGKKKKSKRPPPTPAQIAHPFADVPLALLQVAYTRAGQGVVQNKEGAVVLVRAGDKLGLEGFDVLKVARGCINLKSPETELTLCADVPEVPRT